MLKNYKHYYTVRIFDHSIRLVQIVTERLVLDFSSISLNSLSFFFFLFLGEESCGIAASPDVAMPESSRWEKFGRRLKASWNSLVQPVARVLTSFVHSFVRSFVFAGQGKSLQKETRRNVSFFRKRMSVAFLKIPCGDTPRILLSAW